MRKRRIRAIGATGSSTVAPLVGEMARRFEIMNLGVRIDVQTGETSRAINDTLNDTADIGMVSRALIHILLPIAAPTLAAVLLLEIGRAVAETAALLFTSGYIDRMPGSLLDFGRALTLHIFDLSMNVTGGDVPAYASALVLVAMLLCINMFAMKLVQDWQRRRTILV